MLSVDWSPQPYNPGAGPLELSGGAWSFDYDGMDASGAVLRNGVYLFVLESAQGSSSASVKFQVTVLGDGAQGISQLLAAPNPVHAGSVSVDIQWQPATQAVELKIYDLNGGLVRDLGTGPSPASWDLRSGGGTKAADGIYIISARIPGERSPACFKLMLAR